MKLTPRRSFKLPSCESPTSWQHDHKRWKLRTQIWEQSFSWCSDHSFYPHVQMDKIRCVTGGIITPHLYDDERKGNVVPILKSGQARWDRFSSLGKSWRKLCQSMVLEKVTGNSQQEVTEGKPCLTHLPLTKHLCGQGKEQWMFVTSTLARLSALTQYFAPKLSCYSLGSKAGRTNGWVLRVSGWTAPGVGCPGT